MATQYFCGNERRRNAVRNDPGFNGIDYLEVLDLESPSERLRQRVLMVRTLNEAPTTLDSSNVEIEGGVRITEIKVEWVIRADNVQDLVDAGTLTAPERDYFLDQPELDHLLLVGTNVYGDYSTYRLRLVSSATDDSPPANFDRMLSEVAFSFKLDCPSDFDCEPDDECPPEPADEPSIDYLAKDYASFRQLILDRLAIIMPDWDERSPADLGITLVELLAYAGDYLSYYQDAAGTEAYLGTARRRTSVRRHARLLDYRMHDGCNARTWVCIEVAEDGGSDGAVLERLDPVTGEPARVLTQIPASRIIDPAEAQKVLGTYDAEVFEVMHDVALYSAHNEITFYTWGDDECCLPAGATRATLRDRVDNRLRLRAGDVLIFQERLDPGTGEEEDADPAHRHAVRLTSVSPEAIVNNDGTRTPGPLLTDDLFDEPIVEVEWATEDALPFPLCISAVIDEISTKNISVARGNVVLCDHGRMIAGETLPPPASAGHRRYRPVLGETDITFRIPYDAQTDVRRPATAMLVQDPRRAVPAVRLAENGDTWIPQRDLLNSDRFATEFVVEMESDGRGMLRFGDDIYGQAPNSDAEFQATYRIGNGTAGNVGAGAIAHVVAALSDVDRVWNPLPARGGTAPESLEEVRQYAPQAFRTQERAVTEADYARMAERHPQVQKAVTTRRWTGSWHTMFVTVDRFGGRPVDDDFEEELRDFLEKFRLAGHDIEIDRPRYVSLEIALTVCVEAGYFRSDVKEALLETFSNRELSDGRRGFFHPDNFTFGQSVYLSQIISRAMDVSGVRWVEIDTFKRWGEPARTEIDDGMIEIGRLEIARLANDPNAPEHGKIEFTMEGGL